MEKFVLARVLHVLGVVLWIGGVAMTTTVLIPGARTMKSAPERMQWFEQVEGRFATQARITSLITGLSGFYMVYMLDAWQRFAQLKYWWMHAMVLVWVIFTVVLFVLEPFVLHRKLKEMAIRDPEGTFARMQRFHWALLSISLVTIIGAVAGSHGWLFF